MIEPKDREWYIVEAISAYYKFNPTGGSLHIVLDDGNDAIEHLEYCKDFAETKGDRAGYYLACLLIEWYDVLLPLLREEKKRWHTY